MPHFIVKLSHEGTDYYLEWGTIVDAPLTYGMPLHRFREFYQEEYGRIAMDDFDRRMVRVEQFGASCCDERFTLDNLIASNRAGENERPLTKQEIIQRYCIDRP